MPNRQAAQTSTTGTVAIPVRQPVDLELIVPALNENSRLPATLRRVVGYLASVPYSAAVVVVDNGSVDGTPDIVLAAGVRSPVPIHLVGCAEPGKGAAVRRGVLTGTSRIVGYQDADLAAPIETLEPILEKLGNGSAVAIASRRCEGSLTERDSVLRKFGTVAFRCAVGSMIEGVSDSQCGFKFFDGAVARQLFARCRIDGFAFDVELLARALSAGHLVSEVPVHWTDQEGSTFRPARDGWRSMREAIQLRRELGREAA